jgi:hypothetical protein
MAPELILALVEDDGRAPPITTYSDVYAFASVCLEVGTPTSLICSPSTDIATDPRLRRVNCRTLIVRTTTL